jgi:hypothetical protein
MGGSLAIPGVSGVDGLCADYSGMPGGIAGLCRV